MRVLLFTHTVQGWLASSQVSLTTTANGSEPIFAETLRYWDPSQGSGATPRYGGMVSSKDIGRGLGWGRTEGYTYDPLGRLSRVAISATSPAPGGSAVSSAERFTYDAAGNILSIRRNEGTGASKALNLSYSGNLLSSVSDSLAGSSYSYLHGKAGTVTSDGRIDRTMAMNVIGKVARVNGTVILNDMLQYATLARYTYLSDGTKISVLDPSDSSYVLYRGSFLMKKDSTGTVSLECITVPEGIIVPDGNSLKMITFVKDCIGSVRSVVDLSDGTVLEQNDYYAFGERVNDSTQTMTSLNRWRFNAKEEQASIAGLPYLDYGARLYDPVIGRWM